MDPRTRTAPAIHTGTIIAAFVVAAIAALWIFQAGETTSTASAANATASREAAAATFGLGRESISTTPGAKVAFRMGMPAGAGAADISWKLEPVAAGTKFSPTRGTGAAVAFTAPVSGSLRLTSTLRGAGAGETTSATVFVVAPASQYAAWNLDLSGSVTINGAPAVRGEALVAGTRVDATRGEVSYQAAAMRSTGTTGRLHLSGTDFTVSAAELAAGRTLNTISIKRSPGQTKRLHAEVEHLDGQRYVAVQTPDAVAMVKGTTFDTVVGDQDSTVEVEHGLVQVLDRYRYYDRPDDVATGESTTVDALETTVAGDTWRAAVDDADQATDVAPENGELPQTPDQATGEAPRPAPQQNGTRADGTPQPRPPVPGGDRILDQVINDSVGGRLPTDGSVPPPTWHDPTVTPPTTCDRCQPQPCATCTVQPPVSPPPSTCERCEPTGCTTTTCTIREPVQPPPDGTTTPPPPPSTCTNCAPNPCATCTIRPPAPPPDGTVNPLPPAPPPNTCTTCGTTGSPPPNYTPPPPAGTTTYPPPSTGPAAGG